MLELWGHQKEARQKAKSRDSFGLFFEVGAGKTGTCISMLRDKYNENKRIMKTLIIGPPIVMENWKREFANFSNVPQDEILILNGSGKKRLEMFRDTEAKIIITNYEVLSVPSMGALYEAIMLWKPEVLVFDESHRIKDYKAKRTKKAIQLADKADYRYILTGTPVLNSLMDIFTQYRVLDQGRSFGKNFFTFRARYFYDKNRGMPTQKYFPDWKTRDGAADEIKQILNESSMHITKDECLDLPPLVKKVINVPLSPRQQKAYNEMKQGFITMMNDKACVAELAITKALRLQQITSGHLPVESFDGSVSEIVKFKDNPRVQALSELLEDIAPAHKVIVWAVFKQNYDDILEVCQKLKLPTVEVTGRVSPAQKQHNVDAFNNDDSIRVLVGHPGSGGIGINLVAASHAIFYSRNFSLEYDIQAEARNYRGGSERHTKVTRIDLVAPGTIDELVSKSLASKQEISYQVLHDNMETI